VVPRQRAIEQYELAANLRHSAKKRNRGLKVYKALETILTENKHPVDLDRSR
jgi:hypothetical protein